MCEGGQDREINGGDIIDFQVPMPAKSKAQQKAAGEAFTANRGETPKSKLKGASLEMYESMTEEELDEMASVKRSKLPDRKNDD